MNASNQLTNINLKKLTSEELCIILNVMIMHEEIEASITEICFELFRRKILTQIKADKSYINDDLEENKILKYIKHFLFQDKICRETFLELLCAELESQLIPLEILKWMDKCHLYHITEYCIQSSVSTLIDQIINKLENHSENEEILETIAYIVINLLMSTYGLSITNSAFVYENQCRQHLDDFIEKALEELIQKPNNVKLFLIVPFLNKFNLLHGSILKKFFSNILKKIITYPEKISLNDAYLLQELWTSRHFPPKIIHLYFEIIKYCTVDEFYDLINSVPFYDLNWKNIVIIISSFSKMNNDGHKLLRDATHKRLELLFSTNNVKLNFIDTNIDFSRQLIMMILFIRQSCLEQDAPQSTYSKWYSYTFGPNTLLKTGSNAKAFSLLLKTLISQVSREPKYCLCVHIERSIRTPAGCQKDMFFYKDVSRAQLANIEQSAQVEMYGVNVPVVSILEEALTSYECVWALQQKQFVNLFLPHILENSKYNHVKEMLLSNGYINQYDISNDAPLATSQNTNNDNYSEELFDSCSS